jgi:Ni/Co efflux regulator RcnB
MKHISRVLALTVLAATLSGGFAVAAVAQDHPDNHRYVRHDEWKKGAHIRKEDWARGEHVDYHQYHLNPPPRGYEWRLVDGNYVMANISTGVISMTVVAH